MQRRNILREAGSLTFFPYLIWAETEGLRFRTPAQELSETTEEHVFVEKFLDLADVALKLWNSDKGFVRVR
jgi:hypothetical protein